MMEWQLFHIASCPTLFVLPWLLQILLTQLQAFYSKLIMSEAPMKCANHLLMVYLFLHSHIICFFVWRGTLSVLLIYTMRWLALDHQYTERDWPGRCRAINYSNIFTFILPQILICPGFFFWKSNRFNTMYLCSLYQHNNYSNSPGKRALKRQRRQYIECMVTLFSFLKNIHKDWDHSWWA